MAGSSTVSKPCFLCWEHGHFRNECPWEDYKCVFCNKATMILFLCKNGNNKGRTFLRCSTKSLFDGFIWLNDLKKQIEVAKKGKDVIVKEDKVKLTMEEGKMKMVVEGNVDDVCKVIVKLGLN